MRWNRLINLFCAALLALSEAFAAESNAVSQARSTSTHDVRSHDEQVILAIVHKIYEYRAKDYICYWRGKPIEVDFVKKFRPYFSEEIIEKFFRDSSNCELVASARYGFTPLDDPSIWSDQQYVFVQFDRPEIFAKSATVEVRFWRSLDKQKPFRSQDHGGTIVYLKKVGNKWKISNLEGTDMLGAGGFHSLVKDHPSVAKSEWKDMDYSRSLKNPKPNK